MPTYFIKTAAGQKGPFTLRVILRGLETGKIPNDAMLVEKESGMTLFASELTSAGQSAPSAPAAPLQLVQPDAIRQAPVQQAPSHQYVPPPTVVARQGEHVLFNEPGVFVSNIRVVLNNVTYPMSGITSVKVGRVVYPNPSKNSGLAVLVLACLCLFCGTPIGAMMESFSSRGKESSPPFVVLAVMAGVGAFVFAVVLLNKHGRSAWTVELSTAGMQRHALEDANQARMAAIVAAINEALISRG